jgi:hypothetical protein
MNFWNFAGLRLCCGTSAGVCAVIDVLPWDSAGARGSDKEGVGMRVGVVWEVGGGFCWQYIA